MAETKKRPFARTMVVSAVFSTICGIAFAGEVKSKAEPLTVSGVAAEDLIESDAADRINYSGKLRMLTQRVAAFSCALTSDIEVDSSHDILEASAKEFEKIMNGLRYGDLDLHILSPETSKTMLRDLDHLEQEWDTIREAIAIVLADGHNVEQAHVIDDHNLKLLELAMILEADINAKYANPFEVSQVDALMIKIAGRQRMLTQKMAKDACEIWTDYHAAEAKEDLVKTMKVFEDSMLALRDGMPAVGIPPAPTPAISKDLEIILTRWAVIKENLVILVEGGELDVAQKTEIFHDLNLELAEINHLVYDYRNYAERHH